MKSTCNFYKSVSAVIVAMLLANCSNDADMFVIQGDVKDGGGKILYLENVGVSSLTLLDSTTIKSDGSFCFKHQRPETPDFYQIRLKNQVVNIAIDSTETVTVHADTLHFAQNCQIENSPESDKIKAIALLQLQVNRDYLRLKKEYETGAVSDNGFRQRIETIAETYKQAVRPIIYANPLSAASYFALFQQIEGLLLFDPYNREDAKAYGAVANTWNMHYPQSARAKQLYNLFTGFLASRHEKQRLEIKEGNAIELFEISLPDMQNKNVQLSEASKDKITLIDFISYSMKESPAHNRQLSNIYGKYKDKGFEIYQISIDADEHSWKNAAVNLPWICVRDPQSVNSESLRKYNVTALPTSFIRDREGEIVARIESDAQLESEIGRRVRN